MKIQYYGHSSFKIISEMGNSILTDPYDAKLVGYAMPAVKADVVTVSHKHSDHSYVEGVSGDPSVLDIELSCCADDIAIESFTTFHDKVKGAKRGKNLVFKYVVDGIPVAHLGDICEIDEDILSKLIGTQVLLIPVGAVYTIDAAEAKAVVDAVKPKIVIPMHYWCPDGKIDIDEVEDFLELFEDDKDVEIIRYDHDTLNIDDVDELGKQRIIVMKRFCD